MMCANNSGLLLEQSLNAFLVDVNPDRNVDGRKDVVDEVHLLVLINGPKQTNGKNFLI
jgi:hypothetical protein